MGLIKRIAAFLLAALTAGAEPARALTRASAQPVSLSAANAPVPVAPGSAAPLAPVPLDLSLGLRPEALSFSEQAPVFAAPGAVVAAEATAVVPTGRVETVVSAAPVHTAPVLSAPALSGQSGSVSVEASAEGEPAAPVLRALESAALPEAAPALVFDGGVRRGEAPEPVLADSGRAPAPALAPARRRRPGLSAAAGVALPLAAALPAALSSGSFWEAVGRSGYWLGNGLAFAYPIPQIYKTFVDGHAEAVPAWRAAVGTLASLALAFNALAAGLWFWGVQNIFGALSLVAPLVIGKWLGGKASSKTGALGRTALVSTVLLALSAGLYFLPALTAPGLMASLASAGGLAQIKLGIQIVTGAMFLLLFAPDIVSVLKGRRPKGFTPGVSLVFFLSSFGFVAWSLQAFLAATGPSERLQFLLYAVQNAVYALISLVSFLYSRGKPKP